MRKKGAIIATVAGLTFAQNLSCSASPPKTPILVLETTAEFGAYAQEILRAEGFNEFQVEAPAYPGLTADFLAGFDVVILTEVKLSEAQKQLLTRYVQDGGNLIAFRPDQQLDALFGIARADSTIADGYIKIEGDNAIGKGLAGDTLQFHGEADQYALKDARTIANLYRDANTLTGNPAIVSREFGKGHAIAFAYNLPKSIVLTRQGNYRNAGLEKDGIKGIRAADMFTDGWVNPLRNAINQADEQMRLVSHAIETGSPKKPLPRLWYFPGQTKSVILLTADGEDSPVKDFDAQLNEIKAKGARLTLYLKGTYVPPAKVKSWVADGFEISGHVDDTEEATHPTYDGMNEKMKSTARALENAYGIDPHTVRNHWVLWCGSAPDGEQDFAAQASIEANNGIHLDCNVYHFDQQSTQGHFLGPIGNFTGSGLPMKFINSRGAVLDVYQSVTQLPDEQWGRGNLFRNFKTLLDRSLDHESYTFINVNLHTDRWKAWSRPEGLQIIDYAKSRGVPIWTAERTLRFLQDRDRAEFSGIDWSNNQLTFQIHAPTSGDGLTLMLPKIFAGKTISRVAQDGEDKRYTLQSIKGYDYALVPAVSGNHQFVITYAEHDGRP